jgi:hypothetical protein
MKYRGLSTPDDPLACGNTWGWGGPSGQDDPFVRAVKEKVRESTVVYNESLPHSKFAVVELQDKKPVALYFDADGDGKLSDQEKFPLTAPLRPGFQYPYAFITSDFLIRTPDRGEIPFRVMLVGSAYGGDRISYMWSPSCVLEGQAVLAGAPMRLVLYPNGFSGSFTTFGSCSFVLLPAGQPLPQDLSHSALSGLSLYKGTFYRVKVTGTHEKNQTVRVAFEKDTSPTGAVAVELKGIQTLKARLTNTMIDGVADRSIHFAAPDPLPRLPAGKYALSRATIGYGMDSEKEWQVAMMDGPAFTADAAQASRIEIGRPALSIRAVKEQERYSRDAKEQSTFKAGTQICLAPVIKGTAGEVYMLFSQKEAASGRMTGVLPHVTILGPDGKQVISTDLDYG